MRWQLLNILFGVFLVSSAATAAAQNSTSDPQALSIAAQSIAALTDGTSVSDVTLSGSATWTAGSDTETGTVVLRAKGSSESRLDLSLSRGARTEVRNAPSNGPGGSWVGTDGVAHAMAWHNCLTDASWFFPSLSSLASAGSPAILLTFVGQGSWQGIAVQHIRSTLQATSGVTQLEQQLSAIDYYLDASSFLPVGVAFNAHPDTDMTAVVPVQIVFSNYQTISGFQVPLHIQKFLNGSLLLDISVVSITFNSGLSDSVFIIQ